MSTTVVDSLDCPTCDGLGELPDPHITNWTVECGGCDGTGRLFLPTDQS